MSQKTRVLPSVSLAHTFLDKSKGEGGSDGGEGGVQTDCLLSSPAV